MGCHGDATEVDSEVDEEVDERGYVQDMGWWTGVDGLAARCRQSSWRVRTRLGWHLLRFSRSASFMSACKAGFGL